jgi:hypothetical protein
MSYGKTDNTFKSGRRRVDRLINVYLLSAYILIAIAAVCYHSLICMTSGETGCLC